MINVTNINYNLYEIYVLLNDKNSLKFTIKNVKFYDTNVSLTDGGLVHLGNTTS